MISAKTVEEVRAYDDIVAVISDYVQLKKKGRNYLGLCPFHSEKTPSFTVSPDKKIFHCFGCKESGDHISFIQKVENIPFSDAIKQIAQKAGIDVVEDNKKVTKEDEIRLELEKEMVTIRDTFKNELAKKQEVLSYLSKRGVNDESIKTFHLGYCPPYFKLSDLLSADHNDQFTSMTGITYKTDDDQLKLRFRGRLMFPILNHLGKTIGYSGRTLDPESKYAKYMNSEETLLFNKRRILYGLNVAKSEIKRQNAVILMEGFMDVIMSHQFGFKHAVATMGTAITADQVRLLKRFTSQIYLAMDSDRAGQLAIERSYEVLKEFEFQVFVIDFNGKDPADILIEKGGDYFQSCIDNRISIIEFLINRTLTEFPNKRIEDVPIILEKLIPILKIEKNPIIQKHYTQLLSSRLNIAEELLLDKLKKSSYTVYYKRDYNNRNKKNKLTRAEEIVLYIIATKLEYRKKFDIEVMNVDWSNTTFNELSQLILKTEVLSQRLLDGIENDELRKELARILIEVDLMESESLEQNWRECLYAINKHKNKARIDQIREELKAIQGSDNDKSIQLLTELQQLKKGI